MERERRIAARTVVGLELTLERRRGSPVTGLTLDLGRGGMCVSTNRPLGIDEVLTFHMPINGHDVDGHARVLREHAPNVYAMRFEDLTAETERLVQTFVAAA